MAHLQSPWKGHLASWLRVAWECVVVHIALQFGNARGRQPFGFLALAYVSMILIAGDATVGDALQGAASVLHGTVQGVFPAMVGLRLIRPAGFSVYASVLAVAVGACLVAMPKSSSIVSKRVALAQIVIVDIEASMGSVGDFMQPLHVAMSTMLGALASILALLLPFPRLGSYEGKLGFRRSPTSLFFGSPYVKAQAGYQWGLHL